MWNRKTRTILELSCALVVCGAPIAAQQAARPRAAGGGADWTTVDQALGRKRP